MDQASEHDLADTVGTGVGRHTLLKEIATKVDGLDATASDDDLDRWWGLVEADRMASGLTLATITKLVEADSRDDPAGPWLQKSDAAGRDITQLTPEGREALRRIGVARR